MLRLASLFGSDYNVGGLTNATLDYATYVSAYAHPALVPSRAITMTVTETGAQAIGATQPAATGMASIARSNTGGVLTQAWSVYAGAFGLTTQALDGLTFTTTALQVMLTLSGILTVGSGFDVDGGAVVNGVRNGAKANVYVDSALFAVVDLYGTRVVTPIYLDGLSHTIQIQHSGSYNGAVQPISGVTPSAPSMTTPNSVSTNLVLVARSGPTFVTGTWTVTALSATMYNIARQGGATSGTLTTGTHDTTIVPGVDVSIPGSAMLTTGEAATFTTDVTMVNVESIAYGTNLGGGGVSSYQSPVYDLGESGMQPTLLEWQQDTTGTSATVRTGNTPTPDASWSVWMIPLIGGYTTSNGLLYSTAGLQAVALPGRYCQYALTLAGVASVPPWVRDPTLYAFDPISDPISARVSFGDGWAKGPYVLAFLAWAAEECVDIDQIVLSARAGATPSGAIDGALAGWLNDCGLAQVTGEQPVTARARVIAVTQNVGGALSLPSVCKQMALLVTEAAPSVTVTGAPGAMTASSNGVTVTRTGPFQYTVSIPSAPYAGLPGVPIGLATTAGSARFLINQHATTTLRAVGAVVTVTFS